jgi:hypothetical protein
MSCAWCCLRRAAREKEHDSDADSAEFHESGDETFFHGTGDESADGSGSGSFVGSLRAYAPPDLPGGRVPSWLEDSQQLLDASEPDITVPLM